MKQSIIFFLACLSTGCQLAVNDRVSLDDFDFSTTDSSELFFKNVRQSSYDLEERREARMNVFRMNADERDSIGIYPAIIHHWALDKAYLWLEPGTGLPPTFDVTIKTSGTTGVITFDGSSPTNHIEAATAMFHAILDQGDIQIGDREIMPIGSEAREKYRLVLNDYYRLVQLK